jgi:hypothetical protein
MIAAAIATHEYRETFAFLVGFPMTVLGQTYEPMGGIVPGAASCAARKKDDAPFACAQA